MQDAASGTRTVKLSTGLKTKITNAVRTVHTAEANHLYISACDMEGYTQMNGHPSERTLWNILSNSPAPQRKSLAGLDNVASEGSESFDMLIKICKTLENEDLIKKLTEGRRYLKGNYRAHCTADNCQRVADHCIRYALSDVKSQCYQSYCRKIHNKSCFECDALSQTLLDVKTSENATGIMEEKDMI